MKNKPTLLIVMILLFSLALAANSLAATVGVEATMVKQLAIDKPPLDVETSTDGKLMFVLVPGEVLIYSDLGDQPTNRIAVDNQFDSLAFAEKLDLLILSSKSNKQVDMVRIDLISEIDSTDGSPL